MTSLDDSGEKDPIDNHLKNQIDKDSFLAGWPVKTKKLISQAIITLDLDQHCFSSFGLWSWDVDPSDETQTLIQESPNHILWVVSMNPWNDW